MTKSLGKLMLSRLPRGSMALFIAMMVFVVTGFIINIWLGKTLGPVDYGIYAVALTIVTTLNLIQTAGLPQAVSTLLSSEAADKHDSIMSDSIGIQLVTTSILTIFLVLFSGLIAHLLHEPRLQSLLQIIALMLPGYGLYALCAAYYNGQRRFGRQALLNFVYAISKLIFVLIGAQLWGIAGAMIGLVVAPFATMLFGRSVFKARSKAYVRRIIKLSAPLTGSALVATLHLSVPLLAVQTVVTTHHELSTGVFAAALNIASVLFFLSTPFTQISLPKVAHFLFSDDAAGLKTFINQQIRLLVVALGLIVSAILPYTRDIMTFLYNNSYVNGSEVLAQLAIGTGLFAVASLLVSMLNGAGIPGLSFKIMSSGLAVLVVLSSILTVQFGQVGAAWAFFISSAIMSLVAFIFLSRRVGFVPSIAPVLKVSVSVLLSSMVISFSFLQHINFSVGAAVAVILYLLILLAIKAISIEDINGVLVELNIRRNGKELTHE